MNKRVLTLFAPALFALVCVPLQAATTTELTLADGTGDSLTIDQNGVEIAHTGTVTDTSSTGSGPHGTIVFVGAVGGFTFNITTARGGGVEVQPSLMNLNSIDALSTGAGVLTLTFTDTGYTDLAKTLNLSASDTFVAGLPNGSTATFSGYANSANTLALGSLIGTIGPFTSSGNPSASSFAANQNDTNPIGASGSLSEVVTLSFKGAGEIDSGFTIANVTVPEPASIIFLGSTLLGLAAFFRKKQAKQG